jgi:lipopolysaccharide/colanic/teichoic acid biosynthesis glycosyltransferase
MQRFFDILFSGMALVFLSPIFFITFIVLRFTGEGEIFYIQTRVGQYGKSINILKFATMLKNSPNIGTGTVTLNSDPRILPVGKFLRKSKINEIPQIVNVLLGDMSLIGPRPQTKRCFEAFPENFQDIIVSVKPGLSGVGSIFFRNEELMLNDATNADNLYDHTIMPYKGKLEEWYVLNKSLKLYFVLIVATIITVVFAKIPFRNSFFSEIENAPDDLVEYF